MLPLSIKPKILYVNSSEGYRRSGMSRENLTPEAKQMLALARRKGNHQGVHVTQLHDLAYV